MWFDPIIGRTFLTKNEMESHAREIAGKNVNFTRKMTDLHPGLEEDTLEILAKAFPECLWQTIQVGGRTK